MNHLPLCRFAFFCEHNSLSPLYLSFYYYNHLILYPLFCLPRYHSLLSFLPFLDLIRTISIVALGKCDTVPIAIQSLTLPTASPSSLMTVTSLVMQNRRSKASGKPPLRLPIIAPKEDLFADAFAKSEKTLVAPPRIRLPPRSRTGCW
jgi:hypothetical protein